MSCQEREGKRENIHLLVWYDESVVTSEKCMDALLSYEVVSRDVAAFARIQLVLALHYHFGVCGAIVLYSLDSRHALTLIFIFSHKTK